MEPGNTVEGLPKTKKRFLHWTVTAAFFLLFISGVVLFVPAFSGLASGGWTRLAHRVGAVLLLTAPVLYAVVSSGTARAWLREALLLDRKTPATGARSTWKTTHKTLIVIGFTVVAVTGALQWFLKGIVPREVFSASLLIHDVAFFGSAIVLLYHIYYESDWWLWKRRHCRNCNFPYCAEACPTRAVMRAPDGTIVRHPQRCNNCRLCMEDCRRGTYYRMPERVHTRSQIQ